MIEVQYAPSFVRLYKKLPEDLKEEVKEKISDFRDKENHKRLKVHKLKGRLSGRYSFLINYQIRIVFIYLDTKTVAFLAIGDHDVYVK